MTLYPSSVGSDISELLDSVREKLDAGAVDVLRYDAGARHLVTLARTAEDTEEPQAFRFPVGATLAGRAIARRAPVVVDRATAEDLGGTQRSGQLGGAAAVPLLGAAREPLGVLQVVRVDSQRFTAEDLERLQDYAEQIAEVMVAQLAAEDRTAAAALQRSLLPSRLPDIEGLDLGARFVAGEAGVSGDWYDVFALPSGSVGIVMGDVAGHGLRASVVMGRLRSALRAYALEHDDPAEVLARLDMKIQHFESGAMATALYAVTKPPFDEVVVACAGHPQPLLTGPGLETVQLELICDVPLGVDLRLPREASNVPLEPGQALLFFTDGLIERRRPATPRGKEVFEDLDLAVAELARVFSPDDASTTCGRILDHMLTIEPPQDDVAVLVLRRDDP